MSNENWFEKSEFFQDVVKGMEMLALGTAKDQGRSTKVEERQLYVPIEKLRDLYIAYHKLSRENREIKATMKAINVFANKAD